MTSSEMRDEVRQAMCCLPGPLSRFTGNQPPMRKPRAQPDSPSDASGSPRARPGRNACPAALSGAGTQVPTVPAIGSVVSYTAL